MKTKTIIARSIIGGIAILAFAFIASNLLASQAETPKKDASQARKGVNVRTAHPGTVAFQLPVYGKLEAHRRIELFAEVGGVLQNTSPPFLEGTAFNKGQTLMQIESSEALASLMSQRSNYINTLTQVLPDIKLDYPDLYDDWQTYLLELDISQPTPEPPTTVNSQAKIFLTSRGVYSAFHSLKSTEERLSKYHIKAPFSGVVTQSLIKPGTLVRIGQPMGTFIDPTLFEIEVSVSLRFMNFLQVGDTVQLMSPDISGNWKGNIVRINKGVDANSQTVKAYIGVRGADLREGMYLNGQVTGVDIADAVAVPRRLIIDNHHIWTVQPDSTLLKKPIEIIEYNEEEAIIAGLREGEIYASESIPGGFTGMKVNYAVE